jgi:hypothetical protein
LDHTQDLFQQMCQEGVQNLSIDERWFAGPMGFDPFRGVLGGKRFGDDAQGLIQPRQQLVAESGRQIGTGQGEELVDGAKIELMQESDRVGRKAERLHGQGPQSFDVLA